MDWYFANALALDLVGSRFTGFFAVFFFAAIAMLCSPYLET